jgi:sirohydrochlorin cobaltochelatase
MKKAILVVSFGTTHEDTMNLTIGKIEKRIKEEFQDFDVKRAFTAHGVINVLKKRNGIHVDTPEEAFEKLMEEGYEEVFVQPLHIIPGLEFDYIKLIAHKYDKCGKFKKILVGRPALYFKGFDEEAPDDYQIFIDAIEKTINKKDNFIFMGHGTLHFANACYSCLQNVLEDNGYSNTFIGNVEGYPNIDDVIKWVKKTNVKEITLMPLMLVAGDHAKNDMASEEEDSWKSILESHGVKVNIYLHGLGEIKEFQDIYINHLIDIIEEKYTDIGKNKKGRRKV